MIQIDKQLIRLDKGPLKAGSLIEFKPTFIADKKIIRYNLTHWVNELARKTAKEDKWFPVMGVKNFDYILIKECTDEEWSDYNTKPDSGALVEGWLKQIIDSKIGDGNTVII